MAEQLRGTVITPTGVITDGVVEIEGESITDVRPAGPRDAGAEADTDGDAWLLPGLVDLHNHGGGGASFTTADPDQVTVAAAAHLAAGTTSVVGSAVTDAPERLLAVIATLADAVEAGVLAGIHAEGPFLSAACCGAQDPAHLRPPDPGLAAEMVAAGRGHLRVVTMAGELPGAAEVADRFIEAGVVVALGHTDAPASTARDFLARARLVTHLYNGMSPLHHRSPGPALPALAAAAAGEAYVELIADGVHLDDETVRASFGIAGDHAVLVSDAMAAAGMSDGDYNLGPQRVEVRDGVARLAGGGSIAGGTSRLLDQVRRQAAAGLDLVRLVRAAATTPAAVLGLDHLGALEPGRRADVLVIGPDLHPRRVMRSGAWTDGHPSRG